MHGKALTQNVIQIITTTTTTNEQNNLEQVVIN